MSLNFAASVPYKADMCDDKRPLKVFSSVFFVTFFFAEFPSRNEIISFYNLTFY